MFCFRRSLLLNYGKLWNSWESDFLQEKVVHWGLLGFQHQQRLAVRLTILFKDRWRYGIQSEPLNYGCLKLRMPTFMKMAWMDRKTHGKAGWEKHGKSWNSGKTVFLISNAHLEFWHFIFHPHYWDTIPGNYSNTSHLGKGDIIFKPALGGDILAAG